MTYLVTLAMQTGPSATVKVTASNKPDAEYRAAFKAETVYQRSVSHVIACRKA